RARANVHRDAVRTPQLPNRRPWPAERALRSGFFRHDARARGRRDRSRRHRRRPVAPVRHPRVRPLARPRARARGTGLSVSVLELDERELCAALRRGDESAFDRLVTQYHAPLRRLALSYVSTLAVADEVVQETWLGVIRGIHNFEGR